MKIYIKKGNKNYKENKMLKKLEEVFEKKLAENPNFEFKPAESFEDLRKLHDKYCVEDASFTETSNTGETAPETSETPLTDSKSSSSTGDMPETEEHLIDPMNREEPNVRSYVTDDEMPNPADGTQTSGPTKTVFDEPNSYEESFQMPGDETSDSGGGSGSEKPQSNPRPQTQKKSQSPSVNPGFDNMSNGRKKRSTKKFAQYCTKAGTALLEFGYVWFVTKDINESKLAEYELSGEIDMTLLLEMDEHTSITVKQFFQGQCKTAEELSKLTTEEKDDFAAALADYLEEKGFAPTPGQDVMINGISILARQGLSAYKQHSEIQSVLTQLRAMQKQDKQDTTYQDVTHDTHPQKETPPETDPPGDFSDLPQTSDPKVTQPSETNTEESASPIIDKPIDTLE